MWSRWVFTVASLMNRWRANRAIRFAARQPRQHLELTRAQRVAGALAQPLCDAGRQHALAPGDAADRIEQLLPRRVLEQVAARAGVERARDVGVGVVGGEDQDAGRHVLAAQALDGLDAVELRHAQIDERHVRLVLDDQIAEIRTLVADLARAEDGDAGHTVVLSTHILAEVEAICRRVVLINEGRKVVDSTLAELTADGRRLEDVFAEATLREAPVAAGADAR